MDIFELILLCALAAVFYVCALLLCGGRISLIHSYQRKNVSEENAGAYAKLYALVMFFVGSGLLAAGAINYITYITHAAWGFIALGVCFVAAIAIAITAQLKYNVAK
ncbi:MAG TPA: hypothetical protein DEF14_10340 [Ruminococcaceae bacterium]|nr:hypothetical protein [Oscillospiraceae bacterium]HBW72823.1 hypothetical protein [Oscillospiraceae bacterium]